MRPDDKARRALMGLDILEKVQAYLRKQFRLDMTPDEAKSNLEARALIFQAQNSYMREYDMGITGEEMTRAWATWKQQKARPN